jgi:hypothetical protein
VVITLFQMVMMLLQQLLSYSEHVLVVQEGKTVPDQ